MPSPIYRVVNVAHPDHHGPAPIAGPPGSREAAAERLLNGLAAEGYRLVGLTGELAVLERAAEGASAAA